MAEADDETLIEPPAKSGGGFPLVAVLLTAVLSGAAAAGGAWFAARTVAASLPVPGEAAAAEPHGDGHGSEKDPVFIALDPPFTVNLADRDLMRYMQAEVQVMARDEKVIQRIEARMPLVRNRLLMLFSAQTYDALSTPEGKQHLQELAREEIAHAIGARDAESSGIESVLFTSLVVQ